MLMDKNVKMKGLRSKLSKYEKDDIVKEEWKMCEKCEIDETWA